MADKTGSDTKLCRHCKMEIPRSAKVCPHCRKKQKKGIGKWIVLGIVAILIIAAVSGGGKDQNTSKKVGSVDSAGTEDSAAAETTAPQEIYHVGDL